MIYRIVKAPPDTPHNTIHGRVYETSALDSFQFNITRDDGSKFAATLDEARQMIPIAQNVYNLSQKIILGTLGGLGLTVMSMLC